MQRNRAERGFSIALGLFACVLAIHLFVQSPFFIVKSVSVRGLQQLDESSIIAHSGIRSGVNIFDVDVAQARQRLLKEPRLDTVRILRRWPARIEIIVQERVPVAMLAAADTLWLVDDKGVVLGNSTGEESLMVLTYPTAISPVLGEALSPPALRAAAGLAGDLPVLLAVEMAEIRALAVDNLELITRNGVVIYFGSWSETKLKYAVLTTLFAQISANDTQPTRIDVSRPETPVVR